MCACDIDFDTVAQIEEEKMAAEKERQEMLANFEKHKELERQQQERIRKVWHCTLPVIAMNMHYEQPHLCFEKLWGTASQAFIYRMPSQTHQTTPTLWPLLK